MNSWECESFSFRKSLRAFVLEYHFLMNTHLNFDTKKYSYKLIYVTMNFLCVHRSFVLETMSGWRWGIKSFILIIFALSTKPPWLVYSLVNFFLTAEKSECLKWIWGFEIIRTGFITIWKLIFTSLVISHFSYSKSFFRHLKS